MKNGLLLAIALVMIFSLVACGNNTKGSSTTNGGDASSTNPSNTPVSTTDESYSQNSPVPTTSTSESEDVKIKLKFMDEEAIVKIFDNPTSQDFLSRLPLSLTFEDFGGFEKMSVLDEGLSTQDAPAGYVPVAGDFAYYAPWKDITIFYGDWKYSAGLVKLGEVESGLEELVEKLKNISDDFTIVIEKMD
jgi:hypothetical protein